MKATAFNLNNIVGDRATIEKTMRAFVEQIDSTLRTNPLKAHNVGGVTEPLVGATYVEGEGLYFVAGGGPDAQLIAATPQLVNDYWAHTCAGQTKAAGVGAK
jgi:hypothetical protein